MGIAFIAGMLFGALIETTVIVMVIVIREDMDEWRK